MSGEAILGSSQVITAVCHETVEKIIKDLNLWILIFKIQITMVSVKIIVTYGML